MTTAALTSPLHDEHLRLGAHLTNFAGWDMPLKYNSELLEHRAVRSAAGLFDLSHMGEIRAAGPDAGAMLDYALAGELSTIRVGRAKYSLLCDSGGGVVDDLVVYRLAEDQYLIVANAANASTVFNALTARTGSFDVTLTNESMTTTLIAVQGPASRSIVSALVSADQTQRIDGLNYYSVTHSEVAGLPVLVARTGYTGEDGFELYASNGHAVELWRALLSTTTEHGGSPAGLACRDTLRLEAGMALYGQELNLETNPFEAGLGRVVALQKNFVGRDELVDLSTRARRRVLVGLVGTGRRAARTGYTVLDASGQTPVGIITSGALSPTLGHPIALAYVDIGHSTPGTQVNVDIRGKVEAFSVSATPFYRRP